MFQINVLIYLLFMCQVCVCVCLHAALTMYTHAQVDNSPALILSKLS